MITDTKSDYQKAVEAHTRGITHMRAGRDADRCVACTVADDTELKDQCGVCGSTDPTVYYVWHGMIRGVVHHWEDCCPWCFHFIECGSEPPEGQWIQ